MKNAISIATVSTFVFVLAVQSGSAWAIPYSKGSAPKVEQTQPMVLAHSHSHSHPRAETTTTKSNCGCCKAKDGTTEICGMARK